MRKLAILAGAADASIMTLMTGQALAFPGETQPVATRIVPEVQAVQYNGYRPRHYSPPPDVSGGPYRYFTRGEPHR
jgi:hypothetical protein